MILGFCIVGAFASNNAAYSITVMLVFGVLGFFMEENEIPIAPCILGIVIGRMLEENFVTTMIKADGNLLAFFDRPDRRRAGGRGHPHLDAVAGRLAAPQAHRSGRRLSWHFYSATGTAPSPRSFSGQVRRYARHHPKERARSAPP